MDGSSGNTEAQQCLGAQQPLKNLHHFYLVRQETLAFYQFRSRAKQIILKVCHLVFESAVVTALDSVKQLIPFFFEQVKVERCANGEIEPLVKNCTDFIMWLYSRFIHLSVTEMGIREKVKFKIFIKIFIYETHMVLMICQRMKS